VLLSFGGVPILTLTNNGGSDTLALFGTSLTSAIEPRHTHSITLSWDASGTVSAWLDDAP